MEPNLNDLLDVPDLWELDDLLDLLEDWLLPDAPLGAWHLDNPLNDTLDWDLLDDLAGLAANTRDGDDLLNYLDYLTDVRDDSCLLLINLLGGDNNPLRKHLL